jgi:hypothetical protein
MPRPLTYIDPSTSGQPQMPGPEEARFSSWEGNDYRMTSMYPPTISPTFLDLPQPAAEQYGPMARGYGHGGLLSQSFMKLADIHTSPSKHWRPRLR